MPTLLSLLLALTANFLYQDPAADQMIRQTLESTYNLELQQARDEAIALEKRFPDHPAGYTLFAETYWWEAQMNPADKSLDSKYYDAQKVAVEKGEAALKTEKYPRIEIMAYLGSAYGSYARFQVTQKSAYFSALRAGLKAHDYADQVFRLDRTYYDVYVGVGAFNYFTGALPAVIKPFAFLMGAHGDRDLGIDQLKTGMTHARYSRTEARIVYYTTMLEDKNYPEAFQTLQKLIEDYPDNFVFYAWMTDLFRDQRKDGDGIAYFDKLAAGERSRAPLMAKYALLEKARLQVVQNHDSEALRTIEDLKALPDPNPLLDSKVIAFQKTIRK